MLQIGFSDKCVTYETFMNDLAHRISEIMKSRETQLPEYISQTTAYKMFGRCNVERWRREGKVTPHIRPGKTEYKSAELRKLKAKVQDYL